MGLYHFCPHFSSCFPAPQQAFVGEMGQRRVSLAAETHGPGRGQENEKSTARSRARKQDPRSPAAGGH